MQYRQFGKLGWLVSALGFGSLHFPPLKDKAGDARKRAGNLQQIVSGKWIDEDETIRLIRYAVDHGVNYLDTAYAYYQGASETIVGQALKDGYRDKIRLVTKMPSWQIQTAADFDKCLDEQFERLQVDYVDLYLLHNMNRVLWPKLRDLGVREWAEKAIAGGRFGHLGFSFHDDFDTFKQIVDEYDWPMCLIQYNYLDIENQAGVRGLKYAAAKGMAVAIMEPLRGGNLVVPPPSVQAVWDSAETKRTPVAWGLQWLWNQPEVSVVLSGMSSMAQLKENIAIAEASRVGSLTADELALYGRVRAQYTKLNATPCGGCRYCMPCSQGVDIPLNMKIYNEGLQFGQDSARLQYDRLKFVAESVKGIVAPNVRAEKCIRCKACEAKCPQFIPISRWMPVIHRALGENGPYVNSLAQVDPT